MGISFRTHRFAELLPVVAILLLASAARIVNAGHFPLFTDEGWSVWAASDPNLQVIADKVASDHHPPLFFAALSRWQMLVGDSHIALRMMSIGAGILCVAVVYRIGADIFGRKPALYATLLFAVLPHAVYYSQEIRHYSWLMLEVTLMALFFLRYLRHPKPRLLILYVLSIAAMLYTLYFGLWVLAVQGLVGLFVWRGTWRQKLHLSVAWAAALVLYIPWLVIVVRQLSALVGGGGIGGFPHSFQTNAEGILKSIDLLSGGQPALMVGLYLLGLWGLWEWRGRPSHWLAGVYVGLCGGGLLAAMLAANLRVGVVSARTLVYLTPMLMLVCGYGLSLIQPRVRDLLAGVLVLFMVIAPGVVQPRLDTPAVVAAVAADYSPGDLIVLETTWDENAVYYELTQGLPGEPEIIRTIAVADQPLVPQFEDQLLAHRRVWVLNWLQAPQIMSFLDEGGMDFRRAIRHEVPVGESYGRFGEPFVHVGLYERPDTGREPFVYGNLFVLHDAVVAPVAKVGQPLQVDLWWSALSPPSLDYSGGVFLLDAEGLTRAEHNGPLGTVPTSEWTVGEWMFDRHTLLIPEDLPPGQYTVIVNTYWYGDVKPLKVNGQDYVVIGSLEITP